MQFRITEDGNAIMDQDGLQRDANYDRIVDKLVPGLKYATLVLTGTQILILNGTPVAIVAANATKKIIPVQWYVDYTFNTAAFITNLDMTLLSGAILMGTATNALSGGASKTTVGNIVTATAIAINTALNVSVAAGNPANGNAAAAATVTMFYRLI
jgi:hypothetical protein